MTRERLPALLAVGVPMALFVVLAVGASGGGELGSEQGLANFLDRMLPVSSEEIHVDPYLQGITVVVAAATAALAAALAVRGRLRAGVFLAGAVGGTVLLSIVTKWLVQRPPIEGPADEYSFPSGSAAWSLATVVAIGLLAPPGRARTLLIAAGAVLVFGLAGTIVFEEWHYPSDVLAAWALAVAWTAFLWLVPFRGARSEPHRALPRRTAA